MRARNFILLCALSFLFVAAGKRIEEPRTNVVVEPKTGIAFPLEIRFSQDGEDYTLQLTGVAARIKWIFKVYAIANYLQVPKGGGDFDGAKILTDGLAKQITIQYVRTVSEKKIVKVLREDFELNTTPEEYREIEANVEKMMAFFVRPVRKGDVFIMRWLSGGRVYVELNGKKLGEVRDELFARSLWAVWFGKNPVVDPEELIPKVTIGVVA